MLQNNIEDHDDDSRRIFLKKALFGAGALVSALPLTRVLAATTDSCGLTPAQGAGPFYPGEDKFAAIQDLTWLPGHTTRALGKVIYVKGRVLDEDCKPVQNANVEIWQASASGKYNLPIDTNPAPVDKNFRYWAEAFTDANGEYLFKTILPGAYPSDPTWTRPPHIHFRVTAKGHHELTTQMYFDGQPLNAKDKILRTIPLADRALVVIKFKDSDPSLEPDTLSGDFDITMRTVR